MCQKKEKFSDRMMVVGAMNGRGVLPLIHVGSNAKINSKYYVDNVLQKFLEVEIPKFYPGELDKVYIHHDAVTSRKVHARIRQRFEAKDRNDLDN